LVLKAKHSGAAAAVLPAPQGRRGPRTAPAAERSKEASADDIHERIVSAVFEHRLAPGTKLVEDRLAVIFGTSRSRIRSVLARLAHEQLVRLEPNRGAFVAAPSPAEAREIFESRRLIEPGIVRRLVDTIDRPGLERLRTLVRDEAKARGANDRHAIIRLSGEFHIVMGELAGNTFLAKTIRELATLTCLIIFLYDAPSVPSCHGDEHAEVLEAIARKDAQRAMRLMLHHLDHVEQSLALESNAPQHLELEQVFA
jgi:DNA-binding GntR family transcriptional regulator